MLKVGIILGSTRPGRNTEAVAKWAFEHAQKKGGAQYELIDLRDFDLPLLDEPVPPSMAKEYTRSHTRAWAKTVATFDAFVFVTPEYNHGTSGALKNAIDYLYKEWNNKVAGFVSFGSAGGTRAVEHLRGICAELQVATVRSQVMFSLFTDFENFSVFKPAGHHVQSLHAMLDQLIAWGTAMQQVRGVSASAAARGEEAALDA